MGDIRGNTIPWSKLSAHLSSILCGDESVRREATWCLEKKRDIDLAADMKANRIKDYFFTPPGIEFCKKFTDAYNRHNGFRANIAKLQPKTRGKLDKIIQDARNKCTTGIKRYEENWNRKKQSLVKALVAILLGIGFSSVLALIFWHSITRWNVPPAATAGEKVDNNPLRLTSNALFRKMKEILDFLQGTKAIVTEPITTESAAREVLENHLSAIERPGLSNLQRTLRLAAAVNAGSAHKKGIEIILDEVDISKRPDEEVREVPEGMRADLLFIVHEAIGNAVRHAFPEGTEGERYIRIGAEMDGPTLVLTISDNGVGLPLDISGQIGQLDHSGEKAFRGLSVVDDLAGRHDWDMWFITRHSPTEHGTTVMITLDTTSWPVTGSQGGPNGNAQGSPPVSQGGTPTASGPGPGILAQSSTEPIGGIVYRGTYQDTSAVPLPEGTLVPVLNSTATPGMTWSAGTTTFLGPQVALPITPALPPSVMGMTPLPVLVP